MRNVRRTPAPVPDINVTPLVDVVLVLLVIFMVVAPQLEKDVPVTLPGIFNVDPDVKAMTDPLKVTIAKAGEFHIGDQQYDLEGAAQALIAEREANPYRRLALRADEKLGYGAVREIFNRAQKIGFPGIALMVGEKHRAGQANEAPAEPPAPGATGG